MIAIRQKTQAVLAATIKMLKAGINPDAATILKQVARSRKTPWGTPSAQLRPAYPGGQIGGKSGTDIETTYEELRDDTQVFLEELVGTANSALSGYNKFSIRAAVLRARILACLQKAGYEYARVTTGGEISINDTFTSADNIDFSKTDAEIDFTGGFATLPISAANLQPIPLDNASIVSVSNRQVAANFLMVFDGNPANVWTAALSGDKYVVHIKLPAIEATRQANAIAVDALTQMGITIEYSNDNYNFYTLVENKTISSYTTFHFDPRVLTDLRISITSPGVAAIRSLWLLKAAYETKATLQSSIRLAKNAMFDMLPYASQYIPLSSMLVDIEKDVPPGTSIDAYIAPVYMPGQSDDPGQTAVPIVGAFEKVGQDRLWFSASEPVSASLSTKGFIQEIFGADTTHVYRHPFPSGMPPALASTNLYKGTNPSDPYAQDGQFLVEYYNLEGLAPASYVPTNENWNSGAALLKGYFSVNSDLLGTIDPLISNSDILLSAESLGYSSMLTEAQDYYQQSVGNYTQGPVSRLVIGVIGNDGGRLLTQNGNYRLTTWVYCPEDITYADQACFCYNYDGIGTIAIAPFSVYLNDTLVVSQLSAYSSDHLDESDLAEKCVTFSYKRGWNKLQILVYVATTQIGIVQADGSKVSNEAVGIYIAPSPFYMARTNPEVVVRAHSAPLTRVPEFTLRHSSPINDDSIWALSNDALPGVLLNRNPATSVTNPAYFDGIHQPQDPAFTLEYRVDNSENRPIGVVFRAVLSKDKTTNNAPKLLGYNVIGNQE